MSGKVRYADKHGDVWTLGDDGLMHSLETAPFPLEYVERKWGPLRPVVIRDHVAEADALRKQVEG